MSMAAFVCIRVLEMVFLWRLPTRNVRALASKTVATTVVTATVQIHKLNLGLCQRHALQEQLFEI